MPGKQEARANFQNTLMAPINKQSSWILNFINLYLQLAETKVDMNIESTLRLIFPLVYNKPSKDDNKAVHLYEMFRDLVENEREAVQYLNVKPQDRQKMLRRLPRSKQSFKDMDTGIYVKFICSYGCALIISKQKKQSPLSLELIVPQQWSSGTNSSKSKMELCEAKSQYSVYLPQLVQYDKSLQSVSDLIESHLDQELKSRITFNEKNPQIEKFTPQEVEKALKDMVFRKKLVKIHHKQKQKINKKVQDLDLDLDQDQDQNEQNKNLTQATMSEAIQYNNSNVNLSWYVPEAVIRKLLGSKSSKNVKKSGSKCNRWLIGFKCSILGKAILQKLQSNSKIMRKEIINLKKCLDQIIYFYKFSISPYLGNDENFFKKLKQIDELIVRLNGGRITTMIEDQNQPDDINMPPPGIVRILKPEAIVYNHQETKLKKIDQYNYKIDRRLPFQSLIDIYKAQTTTEQWSKSNEAEKMAFLDHWVLLVEKTLFNIGYEIGQKDKEGSIIDLDIHMRQMQCEIGPTNLCSLVLLYEYVVNLNEGHYGMDLKSQAKSHIQLMKTICGVIAFESVKMNREKKKSNLKNYKVPMDIEKLHKNFMSHNRLARRAMKLIYAYYKKRERLNSLFVLNGKCDTFEEFGKVVGEETRSAHVWAAYAERLVQIEKQKIVENIKLQQKSRRIDSNGCWVTQPLNSFSKTEKWLYAFVHSIPPDILGLIKILIIGQNPRQSPQTLMNNNQFQILSSIETIKNQQLPIRIHNMKPESIDTAKVNFDSLNYINQIPVFEPKNSIKLIFMNSDQAGGISESMFRKYDKEQAVELQNKDCDLNKAKAKSNLIPFLHPPSDKKMDREHEVYANQYLKPKYMEVQQFLSLFTTRAAEETEIIALCSNILNRRITANCYDSGYRIKQQLFLQAAGQLWSYKDKTQQYFGAVKKLVKQYINVWIYSDTNFSPIIGPFISYLIDEIKDMGLSQQEKQEIKKMPLRLAQKCWSEFQRGEKQLSQNSTLKISWDQRFIITGALCCFRQKQLTEEDEEEIMFLTKLIFQYRISKMFSDREKKPPKKRNFQKQKALSITQAISMNVQAISNYFYINPSKLTETVKLFDESIPADIKWKRNGIYEFFAEYPSGDTYQADIYRGNLYKNGAEVSSLNETIKASAQFETIFGKEGQFQVYPSQTGYVRTKEKVNNYFKVNQKNLQIFLEFSTDGKKIRYVTKTPYKQGQKQIEEKWELIPKQMLLKSDVNLPRLYLSSYYAWFCQTRNCMVFRKKSFKNIFEIGLVIHVKDSKSEQLEISKAFHVVFHGSHEDQNLQKICDIQNGEYEELILRSKKEPIKKLKPFMYLSKIEDIQYILQLKNQRSKQQETHFLLHRYQLRFKLIHKENKIASQSYYGYFIDCAYYDKKGCIFNKFPCLLLKKDDDNEIIMNSHKRIMIVSDGWVKNNGEIDKFQKNEDGYRKAEENKNDEDMENSEEKIQINFDDVHINSFRYDIHDFFGDIRGSTRESQLFLAALMLSIDDNMRMEAIQMTPLEYAMNILKTCFTTRPFSSQQCSKFQNVIARASDQVLLLCQALWNGSIKLEKILPFSQNVDSNIIWGKQKQLLSIRTMYQKKVQAEKISYRQRILEKFLHFIGFQAKNDSVQNQNSDSSSEFQEQRYWCKIDQYKGLFLLDEADGIQKEYATIRQLAKQINLMNKKYPHSDHQIAFPEQIEKNAIKDNKSVMMKELIESVRLSYECFINEQDLLTNIAKQLLDKQAYAKKIDELIKLTGELLRKIEEIIKVVKRQSEDHPDVISGFRPTLSEASFTRILCYGNQIYAFFPKMYKYAAEKLRDFIKIWMDLQTRRASFIRIRILLSKQKIDIVALLRQTCSPRDQIIQKNEWVCFQTEMKIQIWPSQLETYNNLMGNPKEGPFCQLNMGEGKTQVIIPMIILNTIFSKRNAIPRINLLSSLYQQARGNMFRFLSVTGFQIPGFEIPFNRKVQLDKHNIFAIRNIMNCFSGVAYVMVKRQSRLSEILRYHQVALKNQSGQNKNRKHKQQENVKITLEQMPLLQGEIFDIFDEIDAIMTPKKSYIFSVGQKSELPSAKLRFQIINQCLQIFLTSMLKQLLRQKIATTDMTEEDALKIVECGEFPSGLRLVSENISKQKKRQLMERITEILLKERQRHYYSFVDKLNIKEIKEVIQYCVDPTVKSSSLSKNISEASMNQIYIVRGIFAYGVFQHCLTKRCGVDYGVPGPEHVKKVAVPYQAADIPSKTSEYEHPQVSTLLSYIAYYTRGLTIDQFLQCIQALLNLTPTSKQIEYQAWVQILSPKDKLALEIDKPHKINPKSQQHRTSLYNQFKKNRKTIAFWLSKCIFPTDLIQFKQNICSSSFDLAHVNESVGFSGTMDNHWILPNKIKFSPCQTPSIKGTDGKMIYLTLNNTKEICAIAENESPLWQRFIQLALEKKTGCILDVGAICVGKSLKNQIVPWIAVHPLFDSTKYLGISFCDENGKWQVYDIQAQYYINRGTTIPDHQTFVIFDQARTRGADLKMDTNVVAALSLGPDLTKDKFMQAAGRLRKLGRNQTIIILATHQVFSELPKFPKEISQIDKKLATTQIKDLVQLILSWTFINTIHENENLLMNYLNLGWKYVYSKVSKLPYKQEISAELKQKYEVDLSTKMVSELSRTISDKKTKEEKEHITGKHLCDLMQKYGKNVAKQAGILDDVCEREIEAEKEQQKAQQNFFYSLFPISETDQATLKTSIKDTNYIFSQRFKMTNNFIDTTKHIIQGQGSGYELPQAYFVKYSPDQLTLISLREASQFIKNNILVDSKPTEQISLLENLTIKHQLIAKYKLEEELVEAKFVAGYENYNEEEVKYLSTFLQRSLKSMGKNSEERKKHLQPIVSQILKMRRTFDLKYRGSTLEKMVTRLANEKDL